MLSGEREKIEDKMRGFIVKAFVQIPLAVTQLHGLIQWWCEGKYLLVVLLEGKEKTKFGKNMAICLIYLIFINIG